MEIARCAFCGKLPKVKKDSIGCCGFGVYNHSKWGTAVKLEDSESLEQRYNMLTVIFRTAEKELQKHAD